MADGSAPAIRRTGVLWVPVVLFLFAGVLLLNPFPFNNPVSEATPVPSWATDVTPVRQPDLRPDYKVAAFNYRCSDCHKIIPSPKETNRTLTQHREIQLQHGLNTRCFNCQHRTNRDAFVDDFGKEIPK